MMTTLKKVLLVGTLATAIATPVIGQVHKYFTPGTRVYASPDPLDFGVHDDRYLLITLAIAPPEIVQHDDRLYVACLRPALNGIRMAPLRFAPRQC